MTRTCPHLFHLKDKLLVIPFIRPLCMIPL